MSVRIRTFVIAAFGGLGLALTSQLSLADQPEFLSCGTAGCGESVTTCAPEDVCGEDSCGESLFGTIEPLTCNKAGGDWLGLRSHLQESGVTVDANVAQFYMGAVSGGLDNSGRYAGHGDYLVNIDGDKALGMKGLFIKLRAEHRFGQSIGGVTGALLPSAIASDLPLPDSENIYLTNLLFTQMFSETFGVFAGKLDTLDGDQNAFASGRGMTQFSNMAFIGTPIGLRTIPYSTLGTGFVILQDLQPIFTFSVINPRETIGISGINELFRDGVTLAPELRLPTEFFGLPGHQLFGGTWSSRNYVSLDQDPRIILPNIPIARSEDSWSLYYNFDQHLVVDSSDPSKGWGLFGRAGLADESTNPIGWFLSGGIGGNSMIPGRSNDTFGAGYYYAGTSSEIGPLLAVALGGIGDGHGTELYYNVAVTEWFRLTADAQFITPARSTVDSSMLLGLRGVVTF
ncbi:MAG: carbohydrate porin [Planctomycetaceae bacterium]